MVIAISCYLSFVERVEIIFTGRIGREVGLELAASFVGHGMG
jgi:ABC-type anion transport system duplicated permease subunit